MSNQKQPLYPLKSNEWEEKAIKELMKKLYENVDKAKKVQPEIRRTLGKNSKMIIPLKRDYFGSDFNNESKLFDNIEEHHYEAVLLVALRYNWKPEEILALWQVQALPAEKVWIFERKRAGKYQEISSWYKKKSPRDEDEARVWVRSILLSKRWGVDLLAPIKPRKEGDNELRVGLTRKEHDDVFNEGFEKWCRNYLLESPLSYLSAKAKPIEIKRAGRNWMFRTHPEYQATMLALQHAVFQNQLSEIREEFTVKGLRVRTAPVPPAFLYLYYVSKKPEENLKKYLVDEIVEKVGKVHKIKNNDFDGDDLYSFFISNPIHDDLVESTNKHSINFEGYVNALRFEYLRQLYKFVFRGWIEFIFDEYFNKLDRLFEQEREAWIPCYLSDKSDQSDQSDQSDRAEKLAAKTVLNRMMDDFDNIPKAFKKHEQFERYFEMFDEHVRRLDGLRDGNVTEYSITKRIHFFRNKLNTCCGAPIELGNMIDLAARGEWKLFNNIGTEYHRYNYEDVYIRLRGALNVKFTSENGRFEAVYNTETGKIVTDPANLGTYNYAPLTVLPPYIKPHIRYDVEPYKKWGNVEYMSYQDIIRRYTSGHDSAEAENNHTDVQGMIRRRRNELEEL